MTPSIRKIVLSAFLLSLLAWGPVEAAQQPTAQTEQEVLIETFARAKSSVGALYSRGSGGDLSFLCSATAIDRQHGKTVVVTANHCVRKGVAYLITFSGNNFHPLSVWQIPRYEIDPEKYARRYNEPVTDIALFLMEGADVPVISVSETSKARTGAKIAMVGFPLGMAKISYEGILSGYMDRHGSDEDGYLLLQIFGAPGSSGSSVISVESGKVIGVLSGGTNNRGLPVIYATPTSYMNNLMIVPGADGDRSGEED